MLLSFQARLLPELASPDKELYREFLLPFGKEKSSI
jgi:hypothetical protein